VVRVLLALIGSVVVGAAAAALPARPQENLDNEAVFRMRGVYAETERGVFRMPVSVEARALSDIPELKVYRYVLPPGLDIPRARVVLSFVINMPGNRAEPWVAATQLVFFVGREIEEARSDTYAPMTAKVTRLRPSVYLVQSPQFQGPWLKDTYARLSGRVDRRNPEGIVGLLVQDENGQPRKLYPIQVFGD
jgi:hypothetical protein